MKLTASLPGLTTVENTDGLQVGKCSLSIEMCESNGLVLRPDDGVLTPCEGEFPAEPDDAFATTESPPKEVTYLRLGVFHFSS